jgi:hypothetical protein
MFGAVRAFEMKLDIFWKQIENVNVCRFSSCDLHRVHGLVSVRFPRVCAVEMIGSPAENVKMSTSDFHSPAINIRIFENQFSVEVCGASEIFQLELLELLYDSNLPGSFNQEALITFYASLVL